MISNCPSCSLSIEHEDYLFEVRCNKCMTRFNPFMQDTSISESSMQGSQDNSGSSPFPYLESSNAFEEIKKFELQTGAIQSIKSPNSSPLTLIEESKSQEIESQIENKFLTKTLDNEDNFSIKKSEKSKFLFSFSEHLHGYSVELVGKPISARIEIHLDLDENIFDPAFILLETLAKNQNANGIIQLQWRISPDGGKAFFLGVPVVYKKV